MFGLCVLFFFFFKQKTAYEIVSCDWSSDVCSSDLLPLAEPHAGREAQPLEVVDERVVGIEALRRPLQRSFAMREARTLRSFPSTWVLDDRLADRAQGIGARAPDTRAHEDLIGRQVEIVARSVKVSRGSESEGQPRVGLVGRLITTEPGVPIDSQQRAARGARVGDDVRA